MTSKDVIFHDNVLIILNFIFIFISTSLSYIIIIMYFSSQTLKCLSEPLFFIRVTLCGDRKLCWAVHPGGVQSGFERVELLRVDDMRWQ